MRFTGKIAPAVCGVALAALVACGGKAQETVSMLVVFATGDVKLVRAGGEVAIKNGMLVRAGESIRTGEGTVDLQTRLGTAVRVRSNSKLTIEEIAGQSGGANKVALDQGSVFARAPKQARADEFAIRTPTAIAGVRGTSFSVTVNEKGQQPRVRVLDGKVAFAPRAGDAGKKQPEVVLDENKSAALPAEVEKQLQSGKEVDPSSLQAQTFRPTAEERLDKATLVVVKPNDFDAVAAGKDQSALDELAKTRESAQDKMLGELRRENAMRGLDNREELRQYYSKVVTVRMKDGRTYSGAVISRSGAKIVIHTDSSGILTLNSNDVEAVQ